MAPQKRYVIWLEEAGKELHEKVGGKAAGLGEMIKAGIPVPPGFVVTSDAYKDFVLETGIAGYIKHILETVIVSGKPQEYEKASELIRSKFMRATVPHAIREQIIEAYRELAKKTGVENPRVAVRSSATVEDLPEASFAGQQDTYLNVQGEEEVVEYVKRAWASLWTARALSYRDSLNVSHEYAEIAVVVQKMVNSRSSGVMFTLHPVTGEEDKIVIESAWGLGEYVVGGIVTPDQFVIDKNTFQIISKRIAKKEKALFYDPDSKSNVEVKIPANEEEMKELKAKYPAIAKLIEEHGITPDAPSLTDNEVKHLAQLAIKVEGHFGRHMDIEWAIDADLGSPEGVFLVQARP
ncbi:MAG: phosphoenolpyruvate synthase, partial [Desulfurococcales archaeon]|nr:phosphoenolpyruvate synthase [Desulfurococcales archaeon]